MTTDVTDLTFEQEVLVRSDQVPVVVDLWAPWCGPCRSLGPIIEQVVKETGGKVALAKVNIDDNPQVASMFQVQSIPAVFAIKERKVVNSFVGALPEAKVKEWVATLLDIPSEADELVAVGDEVSLRRALELEADHPRAVAGLAELLVERGETAEALTLLARIPETTETRRVAALARLSGTDEVVLTGENLEARLEELLEKVKGDDEARQEYLDLIETLDADDPRRGTHRRALASRLF